MEDRVHAADDVVDHEGIGDVPGYDLQLSQDGAGQALQPPPVAASVVAHQRADLEAALGQQLGQVAADEASGSRHQRFSHIPSFLMSLRWSMPTGRFLASTTGSSANGFLRASMRSRASTTR